MKLYFLSIAMFILTGCIKSQGLNGSFYPLEGAIVMGYVDQGAFLNFIGPSLAFNGYYSKISLGMLPSLRFKNDNNKPKNSVVFPSLGFGITYCYKSLAFQLPVYYNFKTASADGNWKLGFGIGYRFMKKSVKLEKIKNAR